MEWYGLLWAILVTVLFFVGIPVVMHDTLNGFVKFIIVFIFLAIAWYTLGLSRGIF